MDRLTLQRIVFVIGISITIIGFAIHLWIPSEMMNSLNRDGDVTEKNSLTNVQYNETITINPDIETSGKRFSFDFRAYITDDEDDKVSIYLLNKENYERFENGRDIEDLETIKELKQYYHSDKEQHTEYRNKITIDDVEKIYIVIINENDDSIDVNFFYYYSVTPLTYYIGLIVLSFGLAITFSILIWYFNGWKRYFLIGAGINTIFFLLRIATLPDYFVFPIGEIIHFEVYTDYQYWYMGWTDDFLRGEWPYTQDDYFGYGFPPLFILTWGLIALVAVHQWFMGLPIFLAGIGTGHLVYKIVYKITQNEKRAIFSMIFYFLNPFTLVYTSFAWLNPSLFVFFVVLAFYLLHEEKFQWAMVALGIGTMYKQFAAMFFPLMLLYILKKDARQDFQRKFENVVEHSFMYAVPILIVSIPFLIVNPTGYVIHILILNTVFDLEIFTVLKYQLGAPVYFSTFFLLIGTPEFIIVPLAYMIAFYVLLGASFFIILFYFSRSSINDKDERDEKKEKPNSNLFLELIFLSLILILCVQMFYPRGTYKFYLVLLTPFISILFDYKDFLLQNENGTHLYKFKKRFLIPVIVSVGIFFCYRYAYFLILLGFMVFYLVVKRRNNHNNQ